MHVVASSSSCCSGLGALVGLALLSGFAPTRLKSHACGCVVKLLLQRSRRASRREPFSPASLQPAKSHACGCVFKLLLQRSRRASRPLFSFGRFAQTAKNFRSSEILRLLWQRARRASRPRPHGRIAFAPNRFTGDLPLREGEGAFRSGLRAVSPLRLLMR
jgi:hypothetical protein